MISQQSSLWLLGVFVLLCASTTAVQRPSCLVGIPQVSSTVAADGTLPLRFLKLRQPTLRVKGGGEEGEEEDVDLFGDDDEKDAEAAAALKAKAAESAKKAKGDKPPAKTNIILDVKGWDDETDMVKVEELVRAIQMDGLDWGASALEDVGYGIKKLRITCVVVDDKVSIDDLEEKIREEEDYVQSVDVVTMNKV